METLLVGDVLFVYDSNILSRMQGVLRLFGGKENRKGDPKFTHCMIVTKVCDTHIQVAHVARSGGHISYIGAMFDGSSREQYGIKDGKHIQLRAFRHENEDISCTAAKIAFNHIQENGVSFSHASALSLLFKKAHLKKSALSPLPKQRVLSRSMFCSEFIITCFHLAAGCPHSIPLAPSGASPFCLAAYLGASSRWRYFGQLWGEWL